MVKASRRLVIDNAAKLQLKNAYNYIKKDAPQNAEKVKAKILASFTDLPRHPEKHAPDKYRLNNNGSYRAYELFKYRISYHVEEEQITILRIRHTKMDPLEY